MQPHADVHRGHDEDFLVGRQQQRRSEIVGETLRHFGEEIGRRRGHDNKIGGTRNLDVADFGLVR